MDKIYQIWFALMVTMFSVGIIIGPVGAACDKPKLDKAGIILMLSAIAGCIVAGITYIWEQTITN